MGLNFNEGPAQKIKRNVDRINTLKLAISQTNNKERKASLNKELERRRGELRDIQDLIGEV
jgi:FtsZ-binding cell division protein ZapB